jgi:hypothetical protein
MRVKEERAQRPRLLPFLVINQYLTNRRLISTGVDVARYVNVQKPEEAKAPPRYDRVHEIMS